MATVGELADQVLEIRTKLIAQIKAHGWAENMPLNQMQGYMQPYSIALINDYVTYTADRVRALTEHDLKRGRLGQFLLSIQPALASIQFGHISSDPDTVIGGVMMMLQMINERLPTEAKGPVPLDWDSVNDRTLIPKDLAKRLRALESTLSRLEPRANEVDGKISDIEAAHTAAEQLPEDLEELAAKRDEVKEIVDEASALLEQAQKLVASMGNSRDEANQSTDQIQKAQVQAQQLIARSEEALRGSTGVGLANAFASRKTGLSWASLAWVAGLVAALVAAFWIGADRVAQFQTLLKNDSPAHLVWMNVILTVFGVGGPIWFAWLSTKQIGTTLRLAEDYAFKAAVSKAYEGYRKEAVDIDPSLKARLFSSALDRLEEAPIRLMDKESHSSPLQELLSNPSIRKGLESVPGIADKIIALIPTKSGAAVIAPIAAAAAIGSSTTAAKPAKRTKDAETNEE